MNAVTQWFFKFNPEYVGVYQIKGSQNDDWNIYYAYWSGSYWSFAREFPYEAMFHSNAASVFQNRTWRGLAEKP